MLDSRWASIDAFAENNRDNILRDITRLVAVPSVEARRSRAHRLAKAPSCAGQSPGNCRRAWLDTHNAEGTSAGADRPHCRRPEVSGYHHPHRRCARGQRLGRDPYTVRVRDGWLLGRGVADDKGPSILCLYALKYLKDSGAALKYPVRACWVPTRRRTCTT